MKKIFYWSPFLSNVATIGNVLNSAYSLNKYEKILLDIHYRCFGEWNTKKKDLLEKKLNYIKLGKLSINLPISGFIKSRVLSIFYFFQVYHLYIFY